MASSWFGRAVSALTDLDALRDEQTEALESGAFDDDPVPVAVSATPINASAHASRAADGEATRGFEDGDDEVGSDRAGSGDGSGHRPVRAAVAVDVVPYQQGASVHHTKPPQPRAAMPPPAAPTGARQSSPAPPPRDPAADALRALEADLKLPASHSTQAASASGPSSDASRSPSVSSRQTTPGASMLTALSSIATGIGSAAASAATAASGAASSRQPAGHVQSFGGSGASSGAAAAATTAASATSTSRARGSQESVLTTLLAGTRSLFAMQPPSSAAEPTSTGVRSSSQGPQAASHGEGKRTADGEYVLRSWQDVVGADSAGANGLGSSSGPSGSATRLPKLPPLPKPGASEGCCHDAMKALGRRFGAMPLERRLVVVVVAVLALLALLWLVSFTEEADAEGVATALVDAEENDAAVDARDP